MRTRVAALAGLVLVLSVSGCGGSPKASPGPTKQPTTASPSSPAPTTPSTTTSSPTVVPVTLGSNVNIGGVLSVRLPKGWVISRSEAYITGDGGVCMMPRGDTKVVLGCAGVEVDFGPHLPGVPPHSYAPNVGGGWYTATDVEPCPFLKHDTGPKMVGIHVLAGMQSGLKSVGSHRADWNRWNASCAGHTFHPQAWYLPKSKVVIFDYLEHPETAGMLASATFASDGAKLPALPEYVSGHLISATTSKITVQPFHTYGNDAAGKAYAKAHGIGYPFPDDYHDADFGPQRTFNLTASTACVGNVSLGKSISGEPVSCSAFASALKLLPVAIWVLPGSVAESVTESYRP